MDTDELSREAYAGILIEAEMLTHDLTLRYGVLSYSCNNEAEYIDKAEKLTRNLLEARDSELIDLFWGDAPDKAKLVATLEKILKNIEKVRSIPIEKRNYDF